MSTQSHTVTTWWVRCDACSKSVGNPTTGWASLRSMRSALAGWWLPGWGWALCPGCHERARRATDLNDLDDFEAFARLCVDISAEAGS